jgi:catechol 2,3-dioxygenase-like lactoylglutathione lyase family enzyme
MILGLRTAIYPVDDLPRAKRWYSDVLGLAPYFDQPFCVNDPFGNRFGIIENPHFDAKAVR